MRANTKHIRTNTRMRKFTHAPYQKRIAHLKNNAAAIKDGRKSGRDKQEQKNEAHTISKNGGRGRRRTTHATIANGKKQAGKSETGEKCEAVFKQ